MLRSHLVPLIAVIFAAAIFQVANGALGTLLPVRLGLVAAGELATGLIATAYAGGFLVGCLIGAREIRTVGHIRAFATFAATAAVASLLFHAAEAELPLAPYAHVREWFGRVSALPAWHDTAPRFAAAAA